MSSFVSLPGDSTNPYREEDLVVVPAGSNLPSNCVKCGAPTSDKLTKKFHWHTPWLYLLIFVGLIFYVIVALVVQKKVKLEIPFCSVHRAWRTGMNRIGASLLIAALPVAWLLDSLHVNGGWIALIAVVLAFSGLVVLAVVGSSFSAVYIDENCAKFKGACEQFLTTLPTGTVPMPTGV